MKTSFIKYIAILSAGAILITSCAKKIEIEPQFILDGSSPLANIEQAENALTGTYNGFLSTGYYDGASNAVGGSFSEYADIMSDNLVESRESLGNFHSIAEWTYVSNTDDMELTWLAAYRIISGANIILRDIDKLAGENPKAANRIKGQALAIRAHVHFDLMRYFATTFDRNSAEPAVPYLKTFDVNAKPGRNSVKEVYDNIFADLTAAAAALSDIDKPINTASSKSKIDLLTVRAMQARVNFYAGQWQAAIDAATPVIAAKPLASIDEFPLIWTDESRAEVIWAVNFATPADGQPFGTVFSVPNNRAEFKPAIQLVNLYDQNNDIRFFTYFADAGRLVVGKHIGRDFGTNLNGVVDWKVFRVAEMYLIRAESYYRLNKETEARNDLNAIRTARIDGFTPGTESGAALLTAIQLERRKEMAYEGDRFFDLKRMNKTPINRCPSTIDSPSTICSLPSTSRAWTWPIPFDELNANPNMTQNPGY